jgi:hypothetical protein
MPLYLVDPGKSLMSLLGRDLTALAALPLTAVLVALEVTMPGTFRAPVYIRNRGQCQHIARSISSRRDTTQT